MRIQRHAMLGVAAALLGLGAIVAHAGPESGGGDDLLGDSPHAGTVRARLVSSVAEIGREEPFLLGVLIEMDSGWHTYWENGGDAGLPTTIEWTLPEGWSAGPILWPTPHRYEEDGDLVTFGYANETLLLTEITPAPGSEGNVEIAALVDWLQCKDICIPGGADVSVRLPVGPVAKPAEPKTVARFAASRALVPVSGAAVENVGLQAFQDPDVIAPGENGEVGVVFSGLGASSAAGAEFFPRPTYDLWFRDGTFRWDGENLGLRVPVEVDAAVEAGSVVILPGVAMLPREGEDPLYLTFDIPVTVAEEGQGGLPSSATVFSDVGPLLSMDDEEPVEAGATGAVGLLRYLVLAFLGGIILNIMPCVLPVISLKILGFVSKAEEDPRKVARLGWTFASGVVLSFLVLALAVIGLKAAGEHIGWGFQFQNPVFVAGLTAVIFVFSLSLLGVFEVGGMTAMLGLGMAAAERKDYADAFFHGVLTTILATPCTAPMLGTAVAFAFAQPAGVILLIFGTIALGLASPYVALSLHPGWLKYVPRPGLWMERFKQVMGFLLLATMVWLLFVFGAQTGSDGLIWLLAFLLVVGFFCWMHGTFVNLASTRRRVTVVWLATIVGVGATYEMALHDVLFPPAQAHVRTGSGPQIGPRIEVTNGGIRWEPFSVDYLTESVTEGKTVFLDFTADWCWTCKVNERTVLADADVEEMFRRNQVLTLKGDWTSKDPEITEILQRHNRAGVPFYAVYPAGNPENVIVLPEIINKKLVLESLEKAGPSRGGV